MKCSVEYKNYNANFKNKKTTDCVVRALATATNKDYKIVVQELVNIWLETGYTINEKRCYEKWLEHNGFEKMKQPRKNNNSKYEVREIDELVNSSCIAIITIANHMTCYNGKDNSIYDIWDCRKKSISNYYVKIGEVKINGTIQKRRICL